MEFEDDRRRKDTRMLRRMQIRGRISWRLHMPGPLRCQILCATVRAAPGTREVSPSTTQRTATPNSIICVAMVCTKVDSSNA
jgi:hypothetical protein